MNKLTPRQKDCVLLLAAGLCNKSIANRLGISVSAVKVYLAQTYQKLGFDMPGRNPRVLAALWVVAQ